MMRNGKRKKITAMLALMLAAVMTLIQPAQTLAANPAKEYLSEVRISTAKTADSAKKWLTDNGYTVQDKNLNEGTKENPVYLGYKTTSDPEKAITDMAVMDMKGGYSFGEYETMLEEQRNKIKPLLAGFKAAVNEFCDNYEKNSPAAKTAYKLMNYFVEDDSGLPMGRFLLDEGLTDDDLTKVFMQGNSVSILTIQEALSMGCADYGKKSWLERLSDLGAAELSAKYDNKARKIYDMWDALQDELLEYKNGKVHITDSEAKVKAYIDGLTEEKGTAWGQTAAMYEVLNITEYEDGTLADFFTRDKEDLDMDELYPLASVLSDGQLGIASFVGLRSLIIAAPTEKTGWSAAKESMSDCLDKGMDGEMISVYAGVDRSIFDGGVALTTEAMRKSASSEDHWYKDNISPQLENVLYILATVGASIGAIGTVTSLGIYAMNRGVAAIIGKSIAGEFKCTVEMTINMIDLAYGVEEIGWMHTTGAGFDVGTSRGFLQTIYDGLVNTLGGYNTIVSVGTGLMYIGYGIALIVAAVYIGLEVYNFYHPTYTEIPRMMVDEVKEEGKDTSYLYYKAVLDQDGKYADLNGWKAKQWNALYTTKDQAAGDPITTEMLVQQGSNDAGDEEYSAIHMFGEKAAFNLNKHCYSDKVNGIYMFVKRDTDAFASTTGSVFTSGTLALSTGLGALGGLAIGIFCMIMLEQRKKRRIVM